MPDLYDLIIILGTISIISILLSVGYLVLAQLKEPLNYCKDNPQNNITIKNKEYTCLELNSINVSLASVGDNNA